MNKTAFLAVAALMALGASAQDFNRAGLTYNNTHYGYEDKDDSFGANGFGLNYIHGFSLSSEKPMFIETGANVNFDFYGENDHGYKVNFTNINLQVPVNFTWHFNIAEGMKIEPYAGINFKIHALSQFKAKEDDHSYTTNLFSKDDMGSHTWNRFQMGWQIGVGYQYEAYYIGLQYGTDFIHAYKDGSDHISTGNFKLALGYCF